MNESLPYLKDLSSGTAIALRPAEIVLVKRYFERIALIVDVCTSNEQLTGKYRETREHKLSARHRKRPAIIDFVCRQAWLAGGALANASIYVGHHVGILGIDPDMNVYHYPVPMDGLNGQPAFPAKRVSMVLRELAVCIDIGMVPERPPCSLTSIDDITNWPNKPKVMYGDYYSLRGQDYRTQMLRLAIKNPQFVSELEKLSRERGTFTAPYKWW